MRGEQGTPVRFLEENNSGTVRPLCAANDLSDRNRCSFLRIEPLSSRKSGTQDEKAESKRYGGESEDLPRARRCRAFLD